MGLLLCVTSTRKQLTLRRPAWCVSFLFCRLTNGNLCQVLIHCFPGGTFADASFYQMASKWRFRGGRESERRNSGACVTFCSQFPFSNPNIPFCHLFSVGMNHNTLTQVFDVALAPLLIQLVSENEEPSPTLQLHSYFR